MMSLICGCSLLLFAALPVEVTSLSGAQVAGTLVKLTATELTLLPESGEVKSLPTADLLEVRFTADRPDKAAPQPEAALVRVSLVDGSSLQLAQLQTTAREVRGHHLLLGDVVLPMASVRSVRFTPANAKFDPLWTQLLEKGTKGDIVVLQKPEVLDHLDGVVGQIDSATIKFLLDGDEISVKREKAFGIIYARKPSTAKLSARVELANGDLLAVKSVAAEGNECKLDAISGVSWPLPATGVAAIDFSLGKVVYLSTIEPRAVKYTPFIDDKKNPVEFYWKLRRDRSLEGKPLRLGQKAYARGLAIHSKTELKYRLGGEYRRFQAVMGIDDEITNTNWGQSPVRILGDRKELYAGECRPRQAPIPLDLDVSGVIELEIIVDWGSDSDISDRVHLADARLVK